PRSFASSASGSATGSSPPAGALSFLSFERAAQQGVGAVRLPPSRTVVAFWRRALRAVAIRSAAGSSTPIRYAGWKNYDARRRGASRPHSKRARRRQARGGSTCAPQPHSARRASLEGARLGSYEPSVQEGLDLRSRLKDEIGHSHRGG